MIKTAALADSSKICVLAQVMQQRQIANRTILMERAGQPKLMAQLKKQPEVKNRYSERKSKHQSTMSILCVIA